MLRAERGGGSKGGCEGREGVPGRGEMPGTHQPFLPEETSLRLGSGRSWATASSSAGTARPWGALSMAQGWGAEDRSGSTQARPGASHGWARTWQGLHKPWRQHKSLTPAGMRVAMTSCRRLAPENCRNKSASSPDERSSRFQQGRPAGAAPLPLRPCLRSWGQSPSPRSPSVPSEAPGSSVPRRPT